MANAEDSRVPTSTHEDWVIVVAVVCILWAIGDASRRFEKALHEVVDRLDNLSGQLDWS